MPREEGYASRTKLARLKTVTQEAVQTVLYPRLEKQEKYIFQKTAVFLTVSEQVPALRSAVFAQSRVRQK
jgi:hypothetical protein